nr:uncharacterized protein LOC113734976 [Coffea arabica]XP_027117581.1 uncharacterized protein LOC113734976 [Coffea arabica]XP_027117582.1 uncharacterized protein LOC113734976 [Coffea arabica]XP_027117583.1 uncharacterized protein LOC113734976 [Coffea arabica]XP_027117584.1 uncharacterized protein LOC113734976 [Coffea arabica]XP_027117585.1 uncharacterized protein LOC113734976 [Coffea arabica]XP_027117586.1 uncharacterized protein LOC113734976 [Coffea arabica]XP_027117587.1 uncharacterized p
MENSMNLLLQTTKQDNLLKLKRRLLMDLPLSGLEKKLHKELNHLEDMFTPETLIREDDVYYDNVRSFVERGFGVQSLVKNQEVKKDGPSFDSQYLLNNLSSLLDKMTNNGLCCLAGLLTEGSIEFEKTRWKMRKLIKEYLPTFLNKENHNVEMRMNQIFILLNNPQYILGLDRVPTDYQTAAASVLDGLEELPLKTLNAMHRKLRGQSGYIPELGPCKHQVKHVLIDTVRKRCMKMLSELREGEELQEPLVKALAVAGLTLKLILCRPSVVEFRTFAPHIESLQNDIARAICLLNSGNSVVVAEIEALHEILHQWADSKVENSKQWSCLTIRNLFMDFLFECDDMEIIPECLVQAVYYINKRFCNPACRSTSKDEVEQEVEFLLCLSAETKQVVWNLLPGQEVDQDFANAYMEVLEESDDDEDEKGIDLPQSSKSSFDDFKDLTECFGETNPLDIDSPISSGNGDGRASLISPTSKLNSRMESVHFARDMFEPNDSVYCSSVSQSKMLDNIESSNGNERQLASLLKLEPTDLHPFCSTVNQCGSSSPLSAGRRESGHDLKTDKIVNNNARNGDSLHYSSPLGERGILHHKQCKGVNKYLSIQTACDETSMAIYSIIGGMLDEFAQAQHLNLGKHHLTYLQNRESVPNDSKGMKRARPACLR